MVYLIVKSGIDDNKRELELMKIFEKKGFRTTFDDVTAPDVMLVNCNDIVNITKKHPETSFHSVLFLSRENDMRDKLQQIVKENECTNAGVFHVCEHDFDILGYVEYLESRKKEHENMAHILEDLSDKGYVNKGTVPGTVRFGESVETAVDTPYQVAADSVINPNNAAIYTRLVMTYLRNNTLKGKFE
jgi:hypothetical protein